MSPTWNRMPQQQQMTGGGPPHGPGEVFKVEVSSVEGDIATFIGHDDGAPVAITLDAEYSRKLREGQKFSVDFRLLHDSPE